MATPDQEKRILLKMLIAEAGDVDLICYLARTEGPEVVRDLLESIADAHALPAEDVLHSLRIVREKKMEASGHPVFAALHRLLHPQSGVPGGRVHASGERREASAEIRLH
jgi:hypothetical protein